LKSLWLSNELSAQIFFKSATPQFPHPHPPESSRGSVSKRPRSCRLYHLHAKSRYSVKQNGDDLLPDSPCPAWCSGFRLSSQRTQRERTFAKGAKTSSSMISVAPWCIHALSAVSVREKILSMSSSFGCGYAALCSLRLRGEPAFKWN
jgi:hypothetical protein